MATVAILAARWRNRQPVKNPPRVETQLLFCLGLPFRLFDSCSSTSPVRTSEKQHCGRPSRPAQLYFSSEFAWFYFVRYFIYFSVFFSLDVCVCVEWPVCWEFDTDRVLIFVIVVVCVCVSLEKCSTVNGLDYLIESNQLFWPEVSRLSSRRRCVFIYTPRNFYQTVNETHRMEGNAPLGWFKSLFHAIR